MLCVAILYMYAMLNMSMNLVSPFHANIITTKSKQISYFRFLFVSIKIKDFYIVHT